MIRELLKYGGFYYWVYYFTAQAVEILSNKDNDFIYYTKLGLISTTVIQTVHCIVTLILIILRDEPPENFCHNNLWVMMRFLGLAVTLGFIFIGWRIQQSILNPLINKQKRKKIMNNINNKSSYTTSKRQHLLEGEEKKLGYSDPDIDENLPSSYEQKSYMSNSRSFRADSETEMDIQEQINKKKKQLRIMWFVLIVILFIGFYEMIDSGVQRIWTARDCGELFGSNIPDSILFFVSRFIGLLLFAYPLIYVYWARDLLISWKLKKKAKQEEEDEYEDRIDEYFGDDPNSASKFYSPHIP